MKTYQFKAIFHKTTRYGQKGAYYTIRTKHLSARTPEEAWELAIAYAKKRGPHWKYRSIFEPRKTYAACHDPREDKINEDRDAQRY